MRRITNVHDKSKQVYDILLTWREGNNIRNTLKKTKISIAELLSDTDSFKKLEVLYNRLEKALPPPDRLSLPYRANQERKDALIARVATLYNDLDSEIESFYRVFLGCYNDGKVQYPFAFEMLAIPRTDPFNKETEFIGAVNYSVSPKRIRFEGRYEVVNEKNSSGHEAENMDDLLERFGFHKYNSKTSRLSCIVIGNLITQRREPHGHDKSRINTLPFSETIATAVKKMASKIPTYRAAGYSFIKEDDYSSARKHKSNRKVKLEDIVKEFLHKERGLPL